MIITTRPSLSTTIRKCQSARAISQSLAVVAVRRSAHFCHPADRIEPGICLKTTRRAYHCSNCSTEGPLTINRHRPDAQGGPSPNSLAGCGLRAQSHPWLGPRAHEMDTNRQPRSALFTVGGPLMLPPASHSLPPPSEMIKLLQHGSVSPCTSTRNQMLSVLDRHTVLRRISSS